MNYNNRMFLTQWSTPSVMRWNYAYQYFNENTGRVVYAQNLDDPTLDRAWDYDHAGRPTHFTSGSNARHYTGQGGSPLNDGPYSQGYGFDKWGNRTYFEGWGGTGRLENATYTNNRRNGFTYDGAGNLTNDGGQAFTYDATGQQASASYSGYSLQQTYDGDRLRVKKVENSTPTYYLRSAAMGGQIVAEINSSGAMTRGFVYRGGDLLAIQQSSAVSWVHQDPVAKSKRITNSSGTVVSTVELDPWGGDTARSSNSGFQPRIFNTYDRDGNASDDAMHRRYNRWHARFDQPDPADGSYELTDPQSFNRYTYAQNDPVNLVDPTGLDPDGDFGLGPPPPVPTLIEYGGTIVTNTTARRHTGGGSILGGDTNFVPEEGPEENPGGDIGGGPVGPTPPTEPPAENPPDIEQPCIDRTGAVKRDIRAIARMIGGKITGFQTGKRFPGGEIDPKGGKFGAIVDVLKKNGFTDNQSFGHPEGKNLQKKFSDGLWYHVIVNYPKGTDTHLIDEPDPQKVSPKVTAHCHGTNPQGFRHIVDTLVNPDP